MRITHATLSERLVQHFAIEHCPKMEMALCYNNYDRKKDKHKRRAILGRESLVKEMPQQKRDGLGIVAIFFFFFFMKLWTVLK